MRNTSGKKNIDALAEEEDVDDAGVTMNFE